MYKLTITTLFFSLINTSSFAYLGPGIGGGLVAATIGIIFAICIALFGLIWFPIKRFLKKKRKKNRLQNKFD